MATSYILNKKETIKKAPEPLKTYLNDILKGIDEKAFFADDNWNKSNRSQWSIKTSASNVDIIKKNYKGGSFTKDVSYSIVTPKDFKLKFLVSKKKSVNKQGAPSDAKTTRMQELGSAWIMKRAIKDNVDYKDWVSIRKDPKYSELIKLYPDVDDQPEWLQTFYGQQERMLKEFSNAKFNEFNREGGFMDFITKLIKDKFGISKKDTWDPADIWLIKNEEKAIKTIKENLEGSKASQTLNELNAILRQMFKSREVVGISLKKLSGKVAQYEEYNLSDEDLNVDYNYKITKSAIDLSFDKSFGTQDSRIVVEGDGSVYNFQIKGNDTAKVSNLKWEPTAKGASKARVGKAPVEMVASLIKDSGLKFVNDHNLFPKDADDFIKNKKTYTNMLDNLPTIIDTKIKNNTEFVNNIVAGYNKEKPIAISKLMQLNFLSEVYKLKTKQRDEFMTDMVFLAAKKGEQFGPFGKLY